MTKKLTTLTITLLVPIILNAQNKGKIRHVDFGVAGGQYQGSLNLSYINNWYFGKGKRLYVGLGGRFTSYLGADKNYITAPARLTSGKTGPTVLFKENIAENIDTLIVNNPQVSALNILVDLGFRFNAKWSLGFNIDFVGFSFGKSQRSNYFSTNNGIISGRMILASPTPFNLLLVSDNDFGTLNSELYVRRNINDKWGIKAGLQFLFTEYKTSIPVQTYPELNDRFRLKSLMLGVGISYRY